MDILLRAARVIHPSSSHHGKLMDVLISNGKVKRIAPKIIDTKAKEIKSKNLHVSLGWVDMNVDFADPGYEQKETIESGCKAAAAGGYTHVCVMPNTLPVTDTKAQIEYLLNKAAPSITTIHPLGAATKGTDGKDLADMYDMYQAGAVAMSDGMHPSPAAGITERALLYIKAFDGILLLHPEEKSISKNGVMNEGITSTRLGLSGMPALAEELAVSNSIYLLEYTQSRLHLLDISTKQSIAMIKAAKKKGLSITATVNAYNLLLDDSAIAQYDTHCKLNPPLRSKADITALVKGIQDGSLDTISSQHQPHDEECKKLEFDKADFGMIGLETCYAVANTALHSHIDTTQLIELMTINARRILRLPMTGLAEGEMADITIFDPTIEWTMTESDIKSKSRNTPFIGSIFIGKVIGIIHKEKISLNHGKI